MRHPLLPLFLQKLYLQKRLIFLVIVVFTCLFVYRGLPQQKEVVEVTTTLDPSKMVPLKDHMLLPNREDQRRLRWGIPPGLHPREKLCLVPKDTELLTKQGVDLEKLHGCEPGRGLHPFYRMINLLRVDGTRYGQFVKMLLTEHSTEDLQYTNGYLNEASCNMTRVHASDNVTNVLAHPSDKPDLIVWQHGFSYGQNLLRLWSGKVWRVQFNIESPIQPTKPYSDLPEWSSDYTSKSIAPAAYGLYVGFDKPECLPSPDLLEQIDQLTGKDATKMLPAGFEQRQSKAYAIISNNMPKYVHNNREGRVRELGKYFPVDVYGRGRTLQCPTQGECREVLAAKYKFYLAFENSDCMEYITEKLWSNAYMTKVIPVVMGASLAEYTRLAPPRSFIHVDEFTTLRELGEFLHKISAEPETLGRYFAWREHGMVIDALPMFLPICLAYKDGKLHGTLERSNTNGRTGLDECSKNQ